MDTINWEVVFWIWIGSAIIGILYGCFKKNNIFWTLCSLCPILNILLAGLVVSNILYTIKRKAIL